MLQCILLPVGLAVHQKRTVKAFEITGSALDLSAQVTNKVLTVKSLLAPLAREEVKIVRCLGLNYADHAVNFIILLIVFFKFTNGIFDTRPKLTWPNQRKFISIL